MKRILAFLLVLSSVVSAEDLDFVAGKGEWIIASYAYAQVYSGAQKTANMPIIKYLPTEPEMGNLNPSTTFFTVKSTQSAAWGGATSSGESSAFVNGTNNKNVKSGFIATSTNFKAKAEVTAKAPPTITALGDTAASTRLSQTYTLHDIDEIDRANPTAGVISLKGIYKIKKALEDNVNPTIVARLKATFADNSVIATYESDYDNGDGTKGAWKIIAKIRGAAGGLLATSTTHRKRLYEISGTQKNPVKFNVYATVTGGTLHTSVLIGQEEDPKIETIWPTKTNLGVSAGSEGLTGFQGERYEELDLSVESKVNYIKLGPKQ